MNSNAIYALSADPLTNGHIDVVKRALRIFDHLIVAIGINDQKKYTFDLNRRERLTKESLAYFGNRVSVLSFTGSLADFAYKHNVGTIVRGIRNSMDFGFEQIINDVNKTQHAGLDTVLLIADQNLSHVSSSAVKELMRIGGKNILEYVPMVVKCALEKAITEQFFIGVTGAIGAGKSYIVEELCKIDRTGRSKMTPPLFFHNIDLDRLGHEILQQSMDPIDVEVRKKIALQFPGFQLENGFIDTKALGSFLFDDYNCLKIFNDLTKEPILLKVREHIRGKKGVIILNSALLAEAGLSEWVNNNVVLVEADHGTRKGRLRGRGYTDKQISSRMGAQLDAVGKYKIIRESISNHYYGEIIEFDNNKESNSEKILELYDKIVEMWVYANKG